MQFRTVNPATGETVAAFDGWNDNRLEAALWAAEQAARVWRQLPLSARADRLRAAARVLREEHERYARLITLEMGKPIREARAEIAKCALACEHYAEHGASYLADELVTTDARRSYVAYLPIGTVLAIMPWNFPFWQVFRCATPILIAGNTMLVKHAPNVPQCALAIEDVFRRAEFPEHTFITLMIDLDQIESVIRDPRVQGVTLTGSERAGRSVAALAGCYIKKTVLELGGSDPFIVLADADIGQAAQIAVSSRYVNSGQSCIAAKRMIPVATIADEFIAEFQKRAQALVMGDPMLETTDIGPLARADLRDNLHRQVLESVGAGAMPLMGCEPVSGPGFFYRVSMLDQVAPPSPAYREELFGPVAAIVRARDDEDAIRIANDSPYGLGGTICSRDPERAQALAKQLQTGATFINAMVKSDPRLPFGGVKLSGYGRELSHHGAREFCNTKIIYLA
jgi:succinate-semialdehyde dehydrogenase/glutarate-semialdehyde dehydrogenase